MRFYSAVARMQHKYWHQVGDSVMGTIRHFHSALSVPQNKLLSGITFVALLQNDSSYGQNAGTRVNLPADDFLQSCDHTRRYVIGSIINEGAHVLLCLWSWYTFHLQMPCPTIRNPTWPASVVDDCWAIILQVNPQWMSSSIIREAPPGNFSSPGWKIKRISH